MDFRLNRRAATVCLALAASIAPIGLSPAEAGIIPTFDLANIAEAGATTSAIAGQVTSIDNTVNALTKVLNVQGLISQAFGSGGSGVPDIGGGSVGSLLSKIGSGIGSVMATANTAEQMYSTITNLLTNPMSANNVAGNLQAIYNESSTLRMEGAMGNASLTSAAASLTGVYTGSQTVQQGQTVIQQTLYTSSTPTEQDQSNALMMRQTVAQSSSVAAMMASSATLNSINTTNSNAISVLATGITAALDERGDMKANSAIQIKILEQLMVENQMLSWLVRVDSSEDMIGQPIGMLSQTDTGAAPAQTTASGN